MVGDVLEIEVAEDDPDRILPGIDPRRTMQVSHEPRSLEGNRPPRGRAGSRPAADRAVPTFRPTVNRPCPSPVGTGSGLGPSTSTRTPSGPWNRTTWMFAGKTGPGRTATVATSRIRPRRRDSPPGRARFLGQGAWAVSRAATIASDRARRAVQRSVERIDPCRLICVDSFPTCSRSRRKPTPADRGPDARPPGQW